MKNFIACLFLTTFILCLFSPTVLSQSKVNKVEFNNVPVIIVDYFENKKKFSIKELTKIKKTVIKLHKNKSMNDYTYDIIMKRLESDINLAIINSRKSVGSVYLDDANPGSPQDSPSTPIRVLENKMDNKQIKTQKKFEAIEKKEAKDEQEAK